MPIEVEVRDVADMLVASVTPCRSTVGEIGRVRGSRAVEPVGFGSMPGVVYRVVKWADGTIEIFVPSRRSGRRGRLDHDARRRDGRGAIHRGPYDELEPAYDALRAWIRERGDEIAGPPTELYLNDPGEVGMENALTEIRFPVR
jgi:hypothetical protein